MFEITQVIDAQGNPIGDGMNTESEQVSVFVNNDGARVNIIVRDGKVIVEQYTGYGETHVRTDTVEIVVR